jgi:acyl-[acyl-carrier-protein]-phospholipid O-acyltransferase/long-chain-fatty-acid--[acyl-carrier-protein] ligase
MNPVRPSEPFSSSRRNWGALFSGNFLGVLNDNFLKNTIIFTASAWTVSGSFTQSELITCISAALVVPYLFLSPLAGKIAVLYSKQRIFRICKMAELPIVCLAVAGFYVESVSILLFGVFLMGVQSCLYSPSKYGLIRDIGGEAGLSFGNGVFEMTAFLGILTGTVVGAAAADGYRWWMVSGLLIFFALAGYGAVRRIRVAELPVDKDASLTANPVLFLKRSYGFARQYRYIHASVLGVSAFWLIGSLVQMNLINHCKLTLGTDNFTAGCVMAAAAVGIAGGCFLAGKLSGQRIRPRLIFVGLAGMALMLAVLIWVRLSVEWTAGVCFLLALFGGLFEVPCMALLQYENTGRQLGNMTAYLNLCIFIFILLGSVLFGVFTRLTDENSYVIFGLIFGLCLLTLFVFWVKYPHFWKRRWEDESMGR